MNSLESFIAQFKEKLICVAVSDLETGGEIFVNADEGMHPASTMKVCVMMEVFRQAQAGVFGLDDSIALTNSFKSIVDGSDFALGMADDSETSLYEKIGGRESIRELTRLMIVHSSNLATNVLMEKVGTARVDAFMRELDIRDLHVIRMIEDNKAYRLGMNNGTSARALTHMMRLIAEEKVVSREASREMIQILLGQEFNESIPALLPADVKVAHKTGWTGSFFHDTGIVCAENRKPYVITILTRGFAQDDEKGAHDCMARVSKLVFEEIV